MVLAYQELKNLKTGENANFVDLCINYRIDLEGILGILLSQSNEGEFASFIAYAIAFPNNFIALLDTYDVLK